MNLLEVRYDSDGGRHFYRDGEEVTESEWRNNHPHMKGTISDGRTGSPGADSGKFGDARADSERQAEVSKGLKALRAEAQRARRAGDELG